VGGLNNLEILIFCSKFNNLQFELLGLFNLLFESSNLSESLS
jgi:hypothetical protein